MGSLLLWLIILIIGLPQISETVYTPALPSLANSLKIAECTAEYTLTVYLLGFALGTLFWGKLSDRIGRKLGVIAGLVIFILGCGFGSCSNNIVILMFARFVQAFGGSIGSVLGQAICRDLFNGAALAKVYSKNNVVLAIFPAIGSMIGGWIAENFGWQNNFLFLVGYALLVMGLIIRFLPETLNVSNRKDINLIDVAAKMLRDRKVIGLGLIVAISYGVSFSYFAEGAFYLIKILGLSPSQYGLSFIVIALGGMAGGFISKKLHNHYNSKIIMSYGILTMVITTGIFSGLILGNNYWRLFNSMSLIAITLGSQMFTMVGIVMITSTALALALEEYQGCIGTASSLFGFYYYSCISLVTLLMGLFRNGSLLVMPLYFFGICVVMWLLEKIMLNSRDGLGKFRGVLKALVVVSTSLVKR